MYVSDGVLKRHVHVLTFEPLIVTLFIKKGLRCNYIQDEVILDPVTIVLTKDKKR